jgi:hypothetical protein
MKIKKLILEIIRYLVIGFFVLGAIWVSPFILIVWSLDKLDDRVRRIGDGL